MKQKHDRDSAQNKMDETQRLAHIEYNTNDNFYRENTETCQSMLAKHRVLPYHWKGMNHDQKRQIMLERAN